MFICRTIVAATALGVLVAEEPARAGSVGVQGSTLAFSANGGEKNSVTMRVQANGMLKVGDSLGTIVADGGACTQPNVNTAADCDMTGVTAISVTLADGDDALTIVRNNGDLEFLTPVTADGGTGVDTLLGLGEADVFTGGEGNDKLTGGPGNDSLSGGEGDDELTEGLFGSHGGNDAYDGGGGNDKITTGEAADGADTIAGGAGDLDQLVVGFKLESGPGVSISIDGQANDGVGGAEGDNYAADIESYVLSQADDMFSGGAHNETLRGYGGNDVIAGGAGNDKLEADDGNDKVDGGAGDDAIAGGPGLDSVVGGAGKDDIHADGLTASEVSGGADTVDAVDGEVDTVTCNEPTDTGKADSIDLLSGCSGVTKVTGGGTTGGGGGTTGGGGTNPADPFPMAVGSRKLGAFLKSGLPVTVRCAAACQISSTLTVSAATARKFGLAQSQRTIARGKAILFSAATTRVNVKVTSKAKRRLRRAKRLTATLKTTVRTQATGAQSVNRKVTLKR